MNANIQRMARYAARHGLTLRPHIKTHKTPEIGALQLRAGAAGFTVATPREALAFAAESDDILLAYPPVGEPRLRMLDHVPPTVRLAVALDSEEAADQLAAHARTTGRTIRVRVEIDLGMRRVGLTDTDQTVRLARRIHDTEGLIFEGINYYPGHIRQRVDAQLEPIAAMATELDRFLDALDDAGLSPAVVSGGSTPAAFHSHLVPRTTEIRPGTYIFNDRITAEIGACTLDDCAYTILATVVSTAVPGQAVVDAGAKAVNREDAPAGTGGGYGVLLDHPDVVLARMSEEHGILDLSRTAWRPRVGDQVRIIPNHVCISVNLHDRLWLVASGAVTGSYEIVARGWRLFHG